ncbi:hypothetical protein POTOM_058866 [Populus tomentosa]|uniref:VQ domain-containing protein n=1 Tax=Populus tomentosa TaxID=118781 RepID=A0A8X7Y1B3_POPTO|nr:hypothetical protein POTOM_058866 [Populus tomentosa]
MSSFREQYFAQQEQPKRGKKSTKNKREPIKIKYISSPTMVKATDATEFRAIVQQLTGKDSKVEDPFDANEEAGEVPRHGTPRFDVESVDGAFCNNTSPFLQTEDGFVWGDVSERAFELQYPSKVEMPRFRQDRAPINCTSAIFASEALHSIKPTDQSGVLQSIRFR